MPISILLLSIMLLLQACGDGSSTPSGNNNEPQATIDFQQLKTDLKAEWKIMQPYCQCHQGAEKMAFFGALTRSIMQKQGYTVPDLQLKANIQGFKQFIEEIGEEL